MRYSIRLAEPKDMSGINLIFGQWHRSAVWDPNHLDPPPDFFSVSEEERVDVAIDGKGQVAGLISVWTPESFIHHLYVHPDYHGRGIGRALLASLENWLPKPWTLKCSVKNDKASGFYRALGWHRQEQGRNDSGAYWLLKYPG